MLIKLFFLRCKYFGEGWNVLDFILVSMAVLDGWILVLAVGGEGSPLGSLSVFRILRVLRVMRLARLLKVFKELWMILKGIFDSLKTMFWVSMLLLLILYVCRVMRLARLLKVFKELWMILK